MSTSIADLATEPIVVRGPSLEDALAAAEAALGRPARAIKADRIRRGGIGGFFATDLGVEVTAVPLEPILRDSEPYGVTDPDLFPTLEADRFDVVGLAADRMETVRPPQARPEAVRPDTARQEAVRPEVVRPAARPVAADARPVDARPLDFDSLDFDAPPTSFEAALDRLVSSAGLADGRPQPTPLTHTPVRDPATRPMPAATVAPAATAPAVPTGVPAQGVPAQGPAQRSPLHSMAPRPQGTPAGSPAASPAFAAPAQAPATRPAVPARAAAPVAPAATVAAHSPRNNAELAALAAGDLLGRVLDRPGAGQVSVTITITGTDGTKCRAEARADRTEGHDGPTQRR